VTIGAQREQDRQLRKNIRIAAEMWWCNKIQLLEERVRILERQVACPHPDTARQFDHSGSVLVWRCMACGMVCQPPGQPSGFSIVHGD